MQKGWGPVEEPHFHPQPLRWSILFILAPGQPSTTQKSNSKATTEVQTNRQEEEGLSKAGWLPPSLPTVSWGAFPGISHSLVLLQGSHQHLWQDSLDPLLCSPAELLQNAGCG